MTKRLPDLTDRKLCFLDKQPCIKERCMAWVDVKTGEIHEVIDGRLHNNEKFVGKCAFLISAEQANTPIVFVPGKE